MSRRRRLLAPLLLALALTAPAANAADRVQLTPVARLPFPERGYVLDLPPTTSLEGTRTRVRENGQPVSHTSLTPFAYSDLSHGAVLALDASESMRGRPFAAALAAARSFLAHRSPSQQLAIVTFNRTITTLSRPTDSASALHALLAKPPAIAYGTRINDTLEHALALLAQARIAAGAVVLLTDGADVGSHSTLAQAIARARRQHVRVFTVGLRTPASQPAPLRALAAATGGLYTQARSAAELTPIYTALGRRLASEYLLRYRSNAHPGAKVTLTVTIGSLNAADSYTAPTRSPLAPYQRSPLSRFLLAPASVALIALLAALLVGASLLALLGRPTTGLLDRVGAFAPPAPTAASGPQRRRRRTRPSPLSRQRTRLQTQLELAGIRLSPGTAVAAVTLLTLLTSGLLALLTPPLALAGLLTPALLKTVLAHRLKRVRDAFSDQLPGSLQMLASALRTGHSFLGALGVVADGSDEPTRRELRQVLTDEQLGIPIEQALRHVAQRMANRDLEQVALLAELQRTAGGNSAEVLDTVVETIRERADVRRLARTLSAQGRMARWILTLIPIAIALMIRLLHPDLIRPLFDTTGGQAALALAALMVTAGSLWIKRIIEIDV